MTSVLVIAEHDNTALTPATFATAGAACMIGADRVDIALLAAEPGNMPSEAAATGGIDRVRVLEGPAYTPCLAAVWAPPIAAMAADYSHVLAPATTFGKDLLPRIAALLNVGMLSDVIAIDGPHEFRRPIYAGNAIVRMQADPARKLCATIRTTAFATAPRDGAATIEPYTTDMCPPDHSRVTGRQTGQRSGPQLQTASRVVAGGRGVGGAEGFALVRELAGVLGAAVGASRAAVDSGWVANDLQVGQTGKIIAPDLYVALGISGAIQHMTGIRDSGTIVAINKDTTAPICKAADIVLNADLFTAVPELIAALGPRTSD